jgi:hypothetical protein
LIQFKINKIFKELNVNISSESYQVIKNVALIIGITIVIPKSVEFIANIAIRVFNYYTNRNAQTESQKSTLKFFHTISYSCALAGCGIAGIYASHCLLENPQKVFDEKISAFEITGAGAKWCDKTNKWVLTHGTWADLLKPV